MKKLLKFHAITFVFLFFPLSVVSSGFTKTTPSSIDISANTGKIVVKDGIISVNVKDVPLGDVLRQIEEQCNVRIKGDKSVLEEKVSLWFEDLPLEQGMKRILGPLNYCLMFNDDNKLSGAIIISSEGVSGLQLSQGRRDAAVSTKPEYPAGARDIVKVEGILGGPPEEDVYPPGASDRVNVKSPPGGPAGATEDN